MVIVMNGLGLREIAEKPGVPGQIVETIAFYPSRLEGNVVLNTGGNAHVVSEDTPFARELFPSSSL